MKRLLVNLVITIFIMSCTDSPVDPNNVSSEENCFENGLSLKIFEGAIKLPRGYGLSNNYDSTKHVYVYSKQGPNDKKLGMIVVGSIGNSKDKGFQGFVNHMSLSHESNQNDLNIKVYELRKQSESPSIGELIFHELSERDYEKYQREVVDKHYTGIVLISDSDETLYIQDSYRCTYQKILDDYSKSF